MHSAVLAVVLVAQLLPGSALGQVLATPQCTTVAGGCDQGTAGQAALQNAISAFQPGILYGGGQDKIIFSSSTTKDILASVAYTCQDGSVPPALAGDVIRSV